MDETPDDLHRRIKEARAKEVQDNPAPSAADKLANSGTKGAGLAMRAATELTAALVVSAYIGYTFDKHVHTKPWGMIIMIFLGFIAGFLNIYRAQMGQDFKIGFKKEETKDKNGDQSP